MYENAKELRMPARYADMTEDEMEYDGGWINFVVGAVASIGGLACTALSHSGVIKDEKANQILKYVGIGCTIVGIVSLTGGIGAAATSSSFTTAQGAMLVSDITLTPISIFSFLR